MAEQDSRRNYPQNGSVQSDREKTPRKRNGSRSSKYVSELESPINSLQSPLKSVRNCCSEGKQFHQGHRYNQLKKFQENSVSHKQTPEYPRFTSPRTVSGMTDWASIVEEDERNVVHGKSFRKRLELGRHPEGERLDSVSEDSPNKEDMEDYLEHPTCIETDPKVLDRREKQIVYGINTPEYGNYRRQVPLQMRTRHHPWTPDKRLKYSRRGWDTVIRIWRKQLHSWDPKPKDGLDILSDSSLSN